MSKLEKVIRDVAAIVVDLTPGADAPGNVELVLAGDC